MVKINGVVFWQSTLPGGESDYQPISVGPGADLIELEFEGNRDIADLMFAKAYVDTHTNIYTTCSLRLSHLPYGREGGEWFDYFTAMLNKLNFSQIEIPSAEYCAQADRINNLRIR